MRARSTSKCISNSIGGSASGSRRRSPPLPTKKALLCVSQPACNVRKNRACSFLTKSPVISRSAWFRFSALAWRGRSGRRIYPQPNVAASVLTSERWPSSSAHTGSVEEVVNQRHGTSVVTNQRAGLVHPIAGSTHSPLLRWKAAFRGETNDPLMRLAIYFGMQSGMCRRKKGKLGPEFNGAVVRNPAQQIVCRKNAD